METASHLRDETIECLQDLIQINIDSSRGYRAAADEIENPRIASLFRECATERQAFSEELKRYVQMNAVEPKDSGSIQGTLHRWWLEIRGTVQGGDEHAVLAEAERGEDAIKHRYEDAMRQIAGSPVGNVLMQQYESVKRRHDQVRDMRDARA